MIYTLSDSIEQAKYDNDTKRYKKQGRRVKMEPVSESRTARQNSALHVYFGMIADELNDLGLEFQYNGLNGSIFEMRYTPHLVKEFIWKPIQQAKFDIESTTKITTKQIDEIIDVLTKFFGERGIVLEFPSIDSLMK